MGPVSARTPAAVHAAWYRARPSSPHRLTTHARPALDRRRPPTTQPGRVDHAEGDQRVLTIAPAVASLSRPDDLSTRSWRSPRPG
jgi:hypothetical protein